MPSPFEGVPMPTQGNRTERTSLPQALAESGAVILEPAESFPGSDLSALVDLTEGTRLSLTILAERCRTFLSLPLVADAFEDHFQRSDWRTKLKQDAEPATVRFFEENRLRGNSNSQIVNIAPTLKRRLDAEAPRLPQTLALAAALGELTSVIGNAITFGDRYNQMTFEEKVRTVREMSAAARAYLSVVTEEESSERVAA